ncbi:MAG TPA: alpha/beta hydrolase [Gammaproteobacteria bacterium]|nr:alpha/beta hydrolase [Gammaproteobacteria bacterium]
MPRERRFDLPGLTLAAVEWEGQGDLPVLAAHGWLDNAGTFDLFAPLLTGCRLVAVDSAGHGRSGFRSPDAGYALWQDVGDLAGVADALGWKTFRLVGHSRGAATAMLLAGTFPERVEQLVLIEGGVPIVDAASDAPEALARALADRRELTERQGRLFRTRAEAIAERANGFSPVSIEAAEILARRSLVEVEGGFRWHVDQRLKARSELRFTIDQVMAFARRVSAPVLMIMAQQSPFAGRALFREAATWFADIETVTLPGRHHLHLEGAEGEIARRMLRFFGVTAAAAE